MKTLTTAALTAAAAAIGMTAAVAGVAGIGVGALLGACICSRGQVRARDREQANGSQPKPAAADAPPTVGA
jgi:Zn-dependent alcohol dehydrogenase